MNKILYAEIVEFLFKGMRAALATIIATKGATPRKDSSRMLIYENGRRWGTMGGGFVEAEVCREALLALKTGKPSCGIYYSL
jgi:xanthine/CO dehydrogenase XdhC/CoxF family maturation factor